MSHVGRVLEQVARRIPATCEKPACQRLQNEVETRLQRWGLGRQRKGLRLNAGVDVVVHAAAMKQVDTCEFNPLEAKKTNVDGAANVIDAALDCGVGRVLALGTDKSVDPTNLYGFTKGTAEKYQVVVKDLGEPYAMPQTLVDNWDNEYSFIGNDGPVLYFKTDLNAPRHRLIGRR